MNPYDGHYYARSCALLKSQRGWIKPLLVLAAVQFVPVVGALGVTGYLLEYARLVAWGVDAAPKQKNVQVGACIRSGWRGFVAGLGAALAATLIEVGLGYLFGADSEAVSFVSSVLSLLAGTISVVCALHATVYQSFRAGYKRRIGQMLSGDFAGIVKISLVYFTVSFVVALALGVLIAFLFIQIMSAFTDIAPMLAYSDTLEAMTVGEAYRFLQQFLAVCGAYAPGIAILIYLAVLGTTYAQLILVLAVGLWFRRFNVPAWGSMDAPLPPRVQPVNPQLPPSGGSGSQYPPSDYTR